MASTFIWRDLEDERAISPSIASPSIRVALCQLQHEILQLFLPQP
jgi:hypothetical protein